MLIQQAAFGLSHKGFARTWLGRWPAAPVSAMSIPVVTVWYAPDNMRQLGESRQSLANARRIAPLNFGDSNTALKFAMCRLSRACVPSRVPVWQLPRSRRRLLASE